MREILTKFQAGYPGHDSMREKAERMFREEMEGAHMHTPVPMSASAPGREKARLYKKGGHVKHHVHHEGFEHPRSKHHRLSHTQKDLVLPKRTRTPKLNIESFEEEEHMKHGGHAHRKHHEYHHEAHRKVGRPRKHYGIGGMIGSGLGAALGPLGAIGGNYLGNYLQNKAGYKKGGKIKHHNEEHHASHKKHTRKHHYDDGGMVPEMPKYRGQGIGNKIGSGIGNALSGVGNWARGNGPLAQKIGEKFPGLYSRMTGLKKGGHAHHRSHKKDCYAAGGDALYSPMDGEHPSHHARHFDYEDNMRGEHGFHSTMKRGGRAHHHERHCHKKHMAAGGVAKIRHGQSTMSGKQIMRKVVKGR